MSQSLLILIPACNESTVIERTVRALTPQLLLGDLVVVIDDGSTDATASIAEQFEARVLRRLPADSKGNKGDALQWGLGQLHTLDTDVVIILDADTQIDPQFLHSLRTCFDNGAQVVQGFIMPITESQSPIAALAACSTLMEQNVDDRLRAWLGWPVRLRGTGMAFRSNILTELLPKLKTSVEDVELSLLLAERGVNVVFVPEAVVYDPLPTSAGAASRQRARWLGGQVAVIEHYWPLLLRLLLYGPGAWSLMGSVLLKPRSLFLALRFALFLLSLLWPSGWPLSVLLGLSLVTELAYIGAAIVLFGKSRVWRASLASLLPYGAMWARGLFMAMRGSRRWLRARS